MLEYVRKGCTIRDIIMIMKIVQLPQIVGGFYIE